MIKLENVCKTYQDGTEAVKDLSLEIADGEFCIFLGPSGCGKTTSLKMINRLIPITAGGILIDGVDTKKLNVNELRRGIGYAIQNIGLFPHLTVAQNIATVPMLKKWPKTRQRARAEELLELVGMDPSVFIDRYPSELSGGQQQRIGVARSLGADPPILLMDEPFGAIDPITRSRLQDEFLKIQAKLKKTIVFVTHDIDEAIKMGDTIALMRKGRLVQYADPATLLYSPKDDFVRDFVGSDRVLKSLRLHKIGEVMQKPPVLAKVGDDPTTLKEQMQRAKIRWTTLSDENNRFLGWLGVNDLKPSVALRDIVEPAVVSAEPDMRLNAALSMMLHSAVGHVAVVDERNTVQGILSFNAIRDVLAQQDEGEEEEAEPSEDGDQR
jgi:osmoprotectant transport system ATP-binding protein